MKFSFGFISIALAVAFQSYSNAQQWLGFGLSPEQIVARVDSFNMVNPLGDKIGSMVLSFEFLESEFIFSDISILDGFIREDAIYCFNRESMQLKNYRIDYKQNALEIDGHLEWNKRHTKGVYNILNNGKERSNKVDTTFSHDIIDRGEVFAFVNALPLRAGLRTTFSVLVQPSFEVWDMTLEVNDSHSITVPAGTFETYKVTLLGGKVSNIIYVSKKTPRKIVKVEVIDQPIEIILISSSLKKP